MGPVTYNTSLLGAMRVSAGEHPAEDWGRPARVSTSPPHGLMPHTLDLKHTAEMFDGGKWFDGARTK